MSLGAAELGLKSSRSPRSPMGELVERRATLRRCLRMQHWCRVRMPLGFLCLAFPFSCNSKKMVYPVGACNELWQLCPLCYALLSWCCVVMFTL